MNTQTYLKKIISLPIKIIVIVFIDKEALQEGEEAAKSRYVNYYFKDGDFARGGDLLLYRRYKSDVAKNHCCNRTDAIG